MSFLCIASLVTLLFNPFLLLIFPDNNEKPEFTIIIPPAILNASILMPKNLSTYSPIKNEIKRMIPTFIAAQIEILDLSFLVSS